MGESQGLAGAVCVERASECGQAGNWTTVTNYRRGAGLQTHSHAEDERERTGAVGKGNAGHATVREIRRLGWVGPWS